MPVETPPDRYSAFAEQAGMTPEQAASWRAKVDPNSIPGRALEVGSGLYDKFAGAMGKAGDFASTPQGQALLSPIPGAAPMLQGLGATTGAIANGIRPPPKDQAQTPAFTRPDVPGTPDSPPPPTAATPGLSTGTGGGGGGSYSTKESTLTTTHHGNPVDQATQDAYANAGIDAKLANQTRLEAAQEMGTAQGMHAAIVSAAQQAYNAAEAREQARKNDALQKQFQQLSADQEAVRSGAVDPNKLMDQMGIGGAILAQIGVALGAGAATYGGGPNHAADILNARIERSIHAQEQNLANKKATVAGQQNLISQLTDQYGSEAKGRLAAHMMLLESVQNQLKASTANITNKDALANAQQVSAGIAEKQAGLQEKFQKLAQDDVTTQTQDAVMARSGGGTGTGNAGAGGLGSLGKHGDQQAQDLSHQLVQSGVPQARAQLSEIDNALKGTKRDNIPGVGGIHGLAALAGGRAEKLDELGYSLFGSQQGQAIRQAAANLSNGILKDQSGAAVSDQELMRFKNAMTGARDAEGFRRGLEGYRNRINQLEATVRSGYSPEINQVQSGRQDAYGGGAPRAATKVEPIR